MSNTNKKSYPGLKVVPMGNMAELTQQFGGYGGGMTMGMMMNMMMGMNMM